MFQRSHFLSSYGCFFFFFSKNRSTVHSWKPNPNEGTLHRTGTLGQPSCRYSLGHAGMFLDAVVLYFLFLSTELRLFFEGK